MPVQIYYCNLYRHASIRAELGELVQNVWVRVIGRTVAVCSLLRCSKQESKVGWMHLLVSEAAFVVLYR